MKINKPEAVDLILIGTGLAGLNFIDKYLEKKKYIHVISPNIKSYLDKKNKRFGALPSQMNGKNLFVENYFVSNNLVAESSCKVLGSLNEGGLSNYWGLQLDNYLHQDQKNLKKKTFKSIENSFIEFLKRYNLLGSYKVKGKTVYENNYRIPNFLRKLIDLKDVNFKCEKPILAFSSKKLKDYNLNNLHEEKTKLNAKNFFKKIKGKNRIISHDCYVDKIINNKKILEVVCRNEKNEKNIFYANKVVFAAGTIATTKIIMDYLNIKNEVKIKHHPRLLSVFFSRKSIRSKLKFTPSLIQIINNYKKDYFTADLRPGNKLITESIIEGFPFMSPFKFFINLIRHRLLFSNILLDSSFSNIFIKRDKKLFKLYNKKKSNIDKNLSERNKKIFKFLKTNKVILPFFKTFFPGLGADYHYFGSIPFSSKGKLAVNDNCQLRGKKNIYIVDGSVFDFKTNKYPLGLMVANARRIGKLLSR
tara:strand:+ start:767 stop:2191 length:1425 start_codon:yes stop_codon:yes gene_type:complete